VATPQKRWSRVLLTDHLPEGPCLYALEEVELLSKSDELLWKLGRTKDLRKRLRGYPNPVAVRFVHPLEVEDPIKEREREMLSACPFSRCRGRGSEWFRASILEMEQWLMGDGNGEN
jgi:hypothetical protein